MGPTVLFLTDKWKYCRYGGNIGLAGRRHIGPNMGPISMKPRDCLAGRRHNRHAAALLNGLLCIVLELLLKAANLTQEKVAQWGHISALQASGTLLHAALNGNKLLLL